MRRLKELQFPVSRRYGPLMFHDHLLTKLLWRAETSETTARAHLQLSAHRADLCPTLTE